jgi:hypothetical protein
MNTEYTEWEIYTGRLIVSFGDIELLTYKLFNLWLTDKSAKEYTIGERINKLIGYVGRLNSKDERKQKIKNLLIAVKKLNVQRNQVAHNPTVLRKYDDSIYESVIIDLRGENAALSLEELHEYANAAESAKSELFIVVSQFTNIGIDEFLTT